MPTDELDQLDFVFESLSKHLTKDERPGLLEMPGIKPEQVAGLYRAAAGFYQRAPWRKLGYETAIKLVFCPFSTVTQAAPRLKARPPGTGVRVLKRPRRTHGLQKPNSPTANALPP